MKKTILSIALAVFTIGAASNFTFSYLGSPIKAMAESTKEEIKKSIEETKKHEKQLMAFYSEVHKKLMDRGYKVKLSFHIDELYSSEPPHITVWAKDEQYIENHGDKIANIIHNLGKSYGLSDASIKLKVRDKRYEMSKEDKERMRRSREIFEIMQKALEERGYRVSQAGLNLKSSKPTLEITIEGSEEYYNKIKDDIKKIVTNAVYEKKHIKMNVKVKRKSDTQVLNEKWQPVFTAIMQETDKHFNEVTGFAYSFHQKPLQIIIKTSLSKDERDSQNKANEIENYVQKVIEIKRKDLGIKKIPYKIIIRGQEKNRLN